MAWTRSSSVGRTRVGDRSSGPCWPPSRPPIIVERRTLAPDAIPTLLEQIDELLAEPHSEGAATLAHLERTLTDGYAYALALESERWRLEQRLSELAGELHEGDQDEKSQELAQISRRLSSNEAALETLRSTLARLRNHATAVRGAAVG